MTDTDLLLHVYKDTLLVKLEEKNDKRTVKLIEAQAQDSVVTIYNLSSDEMVIKVDSFLCPEAIFKGKKVDVNARIMLLSVRKKRCVVCIEMKRTKDEWKQIV